MFRQFTCDSASFLVSHPSVEVRCYLSLAMGMSFTLHKRTIIHLELLFVNSLKYAEGGKWTKLIFEVQMRYFPDKRLELNE